MAQKFRLRGMEKAEAEGRLASGSCCCWLIEGEAGAGQGGVIDAARPRESKRTSVCSSQLCFDMLYEVISSCTLEKITRSHPEDP